MTVEVVALHKYAIRETRQSELGLLEGVDVEVGFTCPRCSRMHAALRHGETGQCEECGLYFAVFGNGLACSDQPISKGEALAAF